MRRFLFGVILTLIGLAAGVVSLPATLQPKPDPISDNIECWCRIDIKRFHDIDTITLCDVYLPYGVVLRDEAIRANDFDGCEISRVRQTVKITDEELALGKAAESEFERLCGMGTLYAKQGKDRRDNYGRLLGSLMVVKSSGERVKIAEWAKLNGWVRK